MTESKFTASAWGLFGWNILIALSAYLLLIPLAFVYPKYVKWYYSHVTIDGKQLEFEFDGPWWGILGWFLFIIVTFGLGSFYAMKKIAQFNIEHTHVVGEGELPSSFDGSAWGILGWSLATSLSAYLLLIPLAFVFVLTNRWYNEHTTISGKRLNLVHEGP